MMRIAKSYNDLRKFNPYHDSLGRFSSANGAASFTTHTKDPKKQYMADMAAAREKKRMAEEDAKKPKIKDPGTQKDHKLGTYGGAERIKEDLGVSEKEAEDMATAIVSYSKSGYAKIRSYQTTGEPKSAEKQAKTLESFIEKSPKWDGGTVYRGIGVSSETAQQIVKNLEEGNSIGQCGVSSWSTSKKISDDFMKMSDKEVKIMFVSTGKQNGTSIRHLSNYPTEDEVLMSNNARWKLAGKIKKTAAGYEIPVSPA